MKETVRVKQPDPPVSKEILAEAIVRIGEAAERLQQDGGLNKRAVVTLLADYTRMGKREIETVLDALPRLRSWYCR